MQQGDDLYNGSAAPWRERRGKGRRAELGQDCAGGRQRKGTAALPGAQCPHRTMSVKTWGCSGQLQLRTYCKMPRVSLTGDRRHPCWSRHCDEPWQGVSCSVPFSDASSTGAAPSGAVLGAAAMKHPQDPMYGDVAATTAGLLPASLSPGHPLRPLAARCPPKQGADPGEIRLGSPVTFVGEAKARGVLLPCLAAARLLQEKAEEERGEGQPVAGGRSHPGARQLGRGQLTLTAPWSSAEMSPPPPAGSREGGRLHCCGLCVGPDPCPTSPWMGRVHEGPRVMAWQVCRQLIPPSADVRPAAWQRGATKSKWPAPRTPTALQNEPGPPCSLLPEGGGKVTATASAACQAGAGDTAAPATSTTAVFI